MALQILAQQGDHLLTYLCGISMVAIALKALIDHIISHNPDRSQPIAWIGAIRSGIIHLLIFSHASNTMARVELGRISEMFFHEDLHLLWRSDAAPHGKKSGE